MLLNYFGVNSKSEANFKIDLIRRGKNYFASKASVNYQQMAGAALHEEMNAMWSRVILPGCKNSLFTLIFSSQIKMSMMSLPCLSHAFTPALTLSFSL